MVGGLQRKLEVSVVELAFSHRLYSRLTVIGLEIWGVRRWSGPSEGNRLLMSKRHR